MKKVFFVLLLLPAFFMSGFYENFGTTLGTDFSEFSNKIGASGVAFNNDKLYIILERCKKILVVNTLSVTKDIIPLNKLPNANKNLEGITIYNNSFFLMDEDSPKIYKCDLNGKFLQEFIFEPIEKPIHKKAGDGFEGITIDSVNKVIYVLHERAKYKSGWASMIYTLKIQEKPKLEILSSHLLPLEDSSWRYTDLFFDKKSLICIKTKYDNSAQSCEGEYLLYRIPIDVSGKLSSDIEEKNITSLVCHWKSQNYDSNIEGVTLDKQGYMYLVSDNVSNSSSCDENKPADKKTLLLKIKNDL